VTDSGAGTTAARMPWGMGWVRHIVRAEVLAPLPLGERYRVQLLVGLSAFVFATSGLSLVIAVIVSGPAISNIPIALAFLATLGATAIVARSPRWLAPLLLAGAVFNQGFVAVMTLAYGGVVASGFNILWAASGPVWVAMFVGRRPTLVITLLFLVNVAFVTAWTAAGMPVGTNPTDPLTGAAYNVVLFGLSTAMAMVWFVEQRDLAEARVDALLHNVLPGAIAERMKLGPVGAEQRDVAVLFADVAGFTPLAATLAPEALLGLLDALFREVDALVDAHGLQKIKTIGDCYMVATGVPTGAADPAALARFSLALRDLVAARDFAGHRLQLRIGMASGPAVAGIIGARRLVYDLWGDTVNTASRLESTGRPGAIHVSEALAGALAERFELESRGPIEVKGKGTLTTSWLHGERAT
jgi:adenylate cyclase